MERREIELEDGKYCVILEGNGGMRALRHGDEWRDLTGDKLVLALVHEIEELRGPDLVKHLYNSLYNYNGDFDGGAELIKRIQQALATPPAERDTADHHGATELGYWP